MILEKIFSKVLASNSILTTDRFLVALSGGGDSVALLVLAASCLHTTDRQLSAIRVSHGLRSNDEERTENEFCEKLCGDLNVPFSPVSIPEGILSVRAGEEGRGIEQSARTARHLALEERRRQIDADWILFGHTAEDQLETIMMRVLAGSGPEGLKGMPQKRSHIFRPLLQVTRESLREYLVERNIGWVEDSSNQQGVYRRNRVRLELLPLINDIFPGWSASLETLGQRSEEVNQALEVLAADALPEIRDGRSMRWNLNRWEKAPEYLKARALWNGFNHLKTENSSETDTRWSWRSLVQARSAVDQGRIWKFSGLIIERREGFVVIERDSSVDAAEKIPDAVRVVLERGDVAQGVKLELGGYRFEAAFDRIPNATMVSVVSNQWPLELLVSRDGSNVVNKKKNGNLSKLTDADNEIVYILITWTG